MRDNIAYELLSQDQIQNKVSEFAAMLSEEYAGKDPIFVGVLKGDSYFRLNDAVVLSGYGTGGIPEGEYYGFYDVIQSWEGKGKTLVVTTQVQHEGSDMSVYQVGRGWKNRFDLLEGYNLTYEAITTKLMWILGYTKDDDKIKELFYKNINYDLIG